MTHTAFLEQANIAPSIEPQLVWHTSQAAREQLWLQENCAKSVVRETDILTQFPNTSSEFQQFYALLFSQEVAKEMLPYLQMFWNELHELWKNNILSVQQMGMKTEDEFIATFISDPENILVYQNQITGSFLLLPRAPYFKALYFSRLNPVVSAQEIAQLESAAVIVLGASSGEVSAKLLGKLGVEVHLTDPDVVDQSNVLRLQTSGTVDVGKSKVLQTGRDIVESNPMAGVYLYPRILPHKELFELIQKLSIQKERVVVVDAIDDLHTKVVLRCIGYALGVPICMNNNVAHEATIVTDQYPTSLLPNPQTASFEDFQDWMQGNGTIAKLGFFGHKHLTKSVLIQKLAELKTKQGLDAAMAFTKLVVEIVGTKYFPPRQMVNLLLGSQGLQNYLSQSGINAAASGAVQSRVVSKILNGQSVRDRVVVDLDAMIGATAEAEDNAYLPEIVENYPIFWQQYADGKTSLLAVLREAVKDVFGLKYEYQYRTE